MPGGSKSMQASMGFGSVSSNESSVTKSGINTANITITQPKVQQDRTGKSVAETIATIHTPLTSDEALAYTGLGNTFDKEAVQQEIDLQRDVSQAFSKNSQEASAELKKRIASNDALFEAGLISEQERDTRNSSLRNYAWILKTVAAGLATPSNSLAGSLVAAASPTVAKEIGQQFKQTGQEGSTGHYLAHVGLGALIAAATGNNIAGNALAAAGSEATAPVAANLIFGKDVSQLTPDEKSIVSSIAGMAGAGLSGAAGGDGRSLVSGSVAGRTSVENNYLTNAQLETFAQRIRNCSGDQCNKVIQEVVDSNIRQQEEIQAFCATSPEQCQNKYGHLLDESDASVALIKKLDIDKTLSNKFRNYLIAIYMLNNEARSLVVDNGWAKRFEEMGLDRGTAEIMVAALPSMIETRGAKGSSSGNKVIKQPKINANQIKENVAVSQKGNSSSNFGKYLEKERLINTPEQVVSKSINPRLLISRQNNNEMSGSQVKRLAKDMKANGYKDNEPVDIAIVNGKMIIIDGHHRAEAARKAAIKEIPVRIHTVTKEQGDQLLLEAADARVRY